MFSVVELVSNLPGRRERITKSSDADEHVVHPQWLPVDMFHFTLLLP